MRQVSVRDNGRVRVGISFPIDEESSVSKTKQSFAKDADINTIMDRYRRTGFLIDPTVPRSRRPFYGDFTSMPDFHENESRIAQVRAEFMRLPSDVRAMFDNDPAKVLDFISKPENDVKAVELGLKRDPASEKQGQAGAEGNPQGSVAAPATGEQSGGTTPPPAQAA